MLLHMSGFHNLYFLLLTYLPALMTSEDQRIISRGAVKRMPVYPSSQNPGHRDGHLL